MSKEPYIVLPIKGKWYHMIQDKIKMEEYRDIKPFYTKRLCNIFGLSEETLIKKLESEHLIITVLFRNGYASTSPSFEARCSLTIKTGREEWGATEGIKYFTFEIIEIKKRDVHE